MPGSKVQPASSSTRATVSRSVPCSTDTWMSMTSFEASPGTEVDPIMVYPIGALTESHPKSARRVAEGIRPALVILANLKGVHGGDYQRPPPSASATFAPRRVALTPRWDRSPGGPGVGGGGRA